MGNLIFQRKQLLCSKYFPCATQQHHIRHIPHITIIQNSMVPKSSSVFRFSRRILPRVRPVSSQRWHLSDRVMVEMMLVREEQPICHACSRQPEDYRSQPSGGRVLPRRIRRTCRNVPDVRAGSLRAEVWVDLVEVCGIVAHEASQRCVQLGFQRCFHAASTRGVKVVREGGASKSALQRYRVNQPMDPTLIKQVMEHMGIQQDLR